MGSEKMIHGSIIKIKGLLPSSFHLWCFDFCKNYLCIFGKYFCQFNKCFESDDDQKIENCCIFQKIVKEEENDKIPSGIGAYFMARWFMMTYYYIINLWNLFEK